MRRAGCLCAFVLLFGCAGDNPRLGGNPPQPQPPGEPCTDAAKCCSANEIACTGDPDRGYVCTCHKVWDCNPIRSKCRQPVQPPDGNGGWRCDQYDEFQGVICRRPGKDAPDGNGRYRCVVVAESNQVVCHETTPSVPTGDGSWTCRPSVSEGITSLVCTRPPPPSADAGSGDDSGGGGGGGGNWRCNSPTAPTRCESDSTLPAGGGNWTCSERVIGGERVLVCTGDSPKNPGGSGGWQCTKLPNEATRWVCNNRTPPRPPGGGSWACVSSSELGGTICDTTTTTPTPVPQPSDVCVPGTKRWCDGPTFCGWGTVTCLPSGKWPFNSKGMLDCKEEDGRRPNTLCGCYHFFFNPTCCERPDCIIPAGTDGQICPASAGKPCDYCNPHKPECQSGRCITNNSFETYCAPACGPNKSCPQGMVCQQVPVKGSTAYQCLPSDLSCFNGL
ncbi:MAG: hypothetical protein KC503_38825 [Myxococcales bacterium]|nr:hypothetical protein [Myxococcales bacterium]